MVVNLGYPVTSFQSIQIDSVTHGGQPPRSSIFQIQIWSFVCLDSPYRLYGNAQRTLARRASSAACRACFTRPPCALPPQPSSGWLRLDPLARFAFRARRPKALGPAPGIAVRRHPLQQGPSPDMVMLDRTGLLAHLGVV
jgi:hypothetical protein